MPSRATRYTLPPSPPSPPSGPPRGMNFSRRKLTQPLPPLPACTWMSASSTNFIGKRPAGPGPCGTRLKPRSVRYDVDVRAALRPLGSEHDATWSGREQSVIAADADVRARMKARAPLANDDVAGEHLLAAKTLHAEPFRLRVAAVLRAAACLLVC